MDKISDVAKTFRNLRNQLIHQNRSRVKLNLNKIKSQKNDENQLRLHAKTSQSRNIGEQKMNTETLKASIEMPKIFQNKFPDGVFPDLGDNNRLESATTLYIETVSNQK